MGNRSVYSLYKVSLILLFVSVLYSEISSQTVIRKYAGEFMAIGVGGRSLGMGGAFTAVANDITAAYYNPAGLANLNYPQISLMHAEQFGDLVNYDYGAVAIPYKEDMSFGLSVMRLGVDGIPDTRNALNNSDRNGDGVVDINDGLIYDRITEFSNQDYAFYLTFAKRHTSDFYYGANVKIIRRSFGDIANATGIGFDIGALYSPFQDFFVGANIQDITTTLLAWNTGLNELVSPTVKLGASYGLEFWGGRFTPALDLDVRFENRRYASQFNIGPVSFDAHAGFEYNFRNLISVRAGYNDVKQFTVGAGVKLPKLNLDYSFARFSAAEIDRLPDTHRISLILTLEEPKFLRTGL